MFMIQSDFAVALDAALKKALAGMTVSASSSTQNHNGLGVRYYNVYVSVNPLPPSRVAENRGGGAETHNNLSKFKVTGWDERTGWATKIKFERFADIIPSKDEEMKKLLRAKSFTDQEKAIAHIVACMQAVVKKYPAVYTHALKGEPEEEGRNFIAR